MCNMSCKLMYTQAYAYMNVVSERSILHASGMFRAFLKCLHSVRHDIACCVHVAGRIPLLAYMKLQKGIKALIIHYLNDYTSIRD